MEEYEERTPTSKSSQRLDRTDLLLSQLQADLRMGRVPEEPTREQRTVLAQVETALHTYLSYFSPHDARE
jgi:hypothetical protein